MAILYSYPKNTNILATDIIVGSSTIIFNGRPKNQTKSFEIQNLATFINAGNTLDTVLQNGNTSLLDAKIGGIFLYNNFAPSGLGYVSITGEKNRFNFYNNVGSCYANIAQDTLSLIDSVVPTRQFAIQKPATIAATRVATFQDASGTIAYLSDIPAITGFVPYTGATQAVNLGAFDLTVNSISIGKGTGTNTTSTRAGEEALQINSTGVQNTAFGYRTLKFNTTGSYNTAIGSSALAGNTTGANNTAIGFQTLIANTSGNNNVAIGNLAFSTATASTEAVAIGAQAMQNATLATDCIAIGYAALRDNQTFYNIAIGSQAMLLTTTGSNNTALGYFALNANTTAIWNVAIGHNALRNNTTGSNNVAIGGQASGSGNTTATQNVAVGYEALFINSANLMTAVGYQSMRQNTTGAQNAAFGAQTLRDNTTGSSNTAVGWLALILNTTGSSNTLMGRAAGSAITTGNNNVGYGANTLLQCSIGSDNVAVGSFALAGSNSGSNNVGVGTNAGRDSSTTNNVTVNNSVFIGYQTKANQSTDTNQIVIGYQAIGAGSNTVTLGNTSITTTRLRGAVQGGSFVKDSGTIYQTLMADGSVTTDGTLYKATSTAYQLVSGASYFYSAVIPSNIFASGDNLKINTITATTAASTAAVIMRYYINTAPSIVGATQIANWSGNLGSISYPMDRIYWVNGGNFYARNFTSSSPSSSNTGTTAINNTPIPGGSFYIIVEIITTAPDLAGLLNFQIIKS